MASEALDEFLQKISLFTNGDEVKDNNEAITLMTVHSAKDWNFQLYLSLVLNVEFFHFIRVGR